MNTKRMISMLIAIVLIISGLFVLTGCEKTDGDNMIGTDIDYASSSADDLLSRIKDKSNVTKDEYVWLISTYSNVKINDDYTLENNITDEAIKAIDSKAKPSLDTYLLDLLKSESPQVRGYGISLITSITGVSNKNLELAKDLIKKEADPYVLYKATQALSNEAKDKEVASFLIKMAGSDNAKIRTAAASALANSWSKGVDGVVETVIKLMNDSDPNVRKAACKGAGKLEDESVIEPLVKILNNPDDADIHSSCIDGLVTLWYDYPFFEKTSEKAYNATMDYLKKTPRTEKVPNWMAVGSFKTASIQNSYTEWKQKATYFNTDDVYNVMVDIIKDPNANWLGRTAAIDVIKAHCSQDQFNSLKDIIAGLTDSKSNLIQQSFANKNK